LPQAAPSNFEEVISVSDGIDVVSGGLLAGGLPVYTVVKEATEAVAKKCGMSDKEAKAAGMIVGGWSSVMTTIFAGTP
jgi:hypothetical protein